MTQKKNDRPSLRAPAPAAVRAATVTQPPAPAPTVAQLRATATSLLGRFAQSFSDADRAWLDGTLSDDDARKRGARATAKDVADEYVRCVQASAHWILAGSLTGYGPRRVRYGLDLVVGMTPALAKLDTLERAIAGAVADVGASDADASPSRVGVARALRNLTAGDAGAQKRIAHAAKGRRGAAAARALAELAGEVGVVKGEVPAAVLEDAGLTGDVVSAASDASQRAAATREVARQQREQAQVIRYELAAPAGRVHRELQLLLAAARDARRLDGGVPSMRSSVVQRKRAAKAAGDVATKPRAPKKPAAPAADATKPAAPDATKPRAAEG